MRIFVILILFFYSTLSIAQRGGTEDKRALSFYTQAREMLKMRKYTEAEIYLQKAIERDPNYLEAKLDLAELCFATNRKTQSKNLLESIVAADPRFAPNIIVNLALMEQMEENFEKSKQWYDQYMTIAPPESSNYRAAMLGSASCSFAIKAKQNPVPFDPINLGNNVNSVFDEYFPALTADESLLLFTRQVENERTPDGWDEDFYFSKKQEDDTWGKAYNPGRPINSMMREGAPTLSPDGKYIIFTSCEIDGYYGIDKQGFGSCDLFISKRLGNEWSKPMNMGPTVNSKSWESQPSFASDGRTLYFIRGRYTREGERKMDIYASELISGKWSNAVALPGNINSPEDEESVFIHPDNQTLYFSSRGHIGMGDMDIFVSRRQKDGSWGDPVNLGYPINTVKQENSLHVSSDGSYALFASDRVGGLGGLDLYSFELPEFARPQRTTYLRGNITDAKTGKPLEASFELIDLSNGDTIVRATSDESTGGYIVVLPEGREYALISERPTYLYHSENFTLKLEGESIQYEKNIALQPIEVGSSVVLKNVFFDTDKFNLKPESQTELNKLVNVLKSNANLKIEISGHTDNQGNAQSNILLSENRAKAVYEYLQKSGIDKLRLTYKGYGAAMPLLSNETEAGRAQNRRTEFKIIE